MIMELKPVLYISTYLDPVALRYVNIKSKSESKPSIAAIKYAYLIKEGMKKFSDIDLRNLYLPTLATYPHSKITCFRKGRIDDGQYIPIVNFLLIKQITVFVFTFVYIFKWIFSNGIKKRKYVVMSSIQLPFLTALFFLKIFNLKIVSFVPDLPRYQFSYTQVESKLKKTFVPLYLSLTKRMVGVIDSYVLITDYMKSFFPNKPYAIMEGIIDKNEDLSVYAEKTKNFTIMYAGALYEKFGLKSLLEAFIDLKDEKCELWLFGVGDMVKTIKEMSLKDSRIIYWGHKPNDEILLFQRQATLLVNPRYSSNEFTKYSFPSKLLEYMSSGTPVLTTKLPGIPEDYFDKMLYFEEETPEGFRRSIEDCMLMSRTELYDFGKKAKMYVFQHKNNINQLNRLKKFLFV